MIIGLVEFILRGIVNCFFEGSIGEVLRLFIMFLISCILIFN